jgi:hypothetical protein
MNKYLATVEVELDGKTYKLKYDYEAISAVISKYSKDILTKMYESTPAEIADIVSIGLRDDKVDAKTIMEYSPPIFTMCKLIDQAIGFAYFGPEGPPKVEKGDKKKP